jgi:glycosyltransferase involved in cell wall biosynthesis
MRIGMMTDAYKPHVSGVTSYIDLNKHAFENLGHEVYVFTFGELNKQEEDPRVILSPGLPLADTGFYLSMRYRTPAKILLQSMDVVHVHHPFLSGRLALRYLRHRHIPIVFTNHTRYDLYAKARLPLMPQEVSDSLLHAYMPDFCDAVDLVISPSMGMKKILRTYGVNSHIEVVPNGTDLKPFRKAKPIRRERFGFDKDDIILVYMGRIAPEKNLEFLFKAFAGVTHAIPNVKLLILGAGQKEFDEKLRALPAELQISDRVCFAGLIPYAQLPAHLAMCDVFVTSSVTEVHPFSVIEAMASGLPVVGIESPGVGDSIIDGESGLLSNDSISAYTAKLTLLCLNRNLQKKMGMAAQKASEQFSIERTTKVMLGHYNRLLQNTKPIKKKLDERLMSILEEFLQ